MEGRIKKIDLHRRIAKVEVDFMSRKTVIEMMEKKQRLNKKCEPGVVL